MAINLQKGQNVSLSQESPGINKIQAGLGWDTQSFSGAAFDLDVMLFLTDGGGKVISDNHFVFYNNLKSPDGAVEHTGDNLTGDGDGDDEVILVNLGQIEQSVEKVIFTASIHEAESRRQNFGQVQNAYIRLVDLSSNAEIIRYDLSEDFSVETSLVVGELYRRNGEWKFKAIGQGYKDGLVALLRAHGINA
ncbi:MAG: TerD family protein [Bacteroidetes bacterium]|nr:TerD family protein [Bacteroidota bacterium]